jgi:hypothetical protein
MRAFSKMGDIVQPYKLLVVSGLSLVGSLPVPAPSAFSSLNSQITPLRGSDCDAACVYMFREKRLGIDASLKRRGGLVMH